MSQIRRQMLMLVNALLDCKDNSSPFTLVLDSLEQSSKCLLRNFVNRAVASKIHVVFVAFETLRVSREVNFVTAYNKPLNEVRSEIQTIMKNFPRSLVIIDSINSIANNEVASFLSSLTSSSSSLVGVYHLDLPDVSAAPNSSYQPSLLVVLRYLATTIMTTISVSHEIERRAAKQRSISFPSYGLLEDKEGCITSTSANRTIDGCIVEVETRRKSGRSTHVSFVLPGGGKASEPAQQRIVLLTDHPKFQEQREEKDPVSTNSLPFNLDLTEQQRQDRENVVLPYFDAQREGQMPGEGGRILYDMGPEDDFDEEEDEI